MPALFNKPCVDCGSMMCGVSYNAKYCPECKRIRNIAYQTKRRNQKKEGTFKPAETGIEKECEQCGAIIKNAYPNTHFCPDCMEERAKQSKQLALAKQRARRIMGTVDKPTLSLTDAVKAATAAGMTYGQWVLHNRLESEQNRRV